MELTKTKARTVKYPRRIIPRGFLRILGRSLLWLLARVEVTGKENLPKDGPYIMAGNHVGIMEAVMMAVCSPKMVEFLGSGDIPLDPKFAWLAEMYEFIPISRGNLDRTGMQMAADVLAQKGVIGIFPEGGIWNPGAMPARTGVALLSGRNQVPVVPVGFGGVLGGLDKIIHLKRPPMSMNIGQPLPPVQIKQAGKSYKEAMHEGAELIMEKIRELIPAEDKIEVRQNTNESFELNVSVEDLDPETEAQCLEMISEENRSALANVLLHPIIMDVLIRNLHLPVKALEEIRNFDDPKEISRSCKAVLGYLEENTGLLTYRFGMDEGIAMQRGLRELDEFCQFAIEHDAKVHIHPQHRYTDPDGNQVLREECGSPHKN